MENCIFCRIVKGEIPCAKVYEDSDILAFEDISPQAPVHIIVIPKKHIAKLHESRDELIIGRLVRKACDIAGEKGILDRGYRLVINTNREAGQTVDHIHFHLLGGRDMTWPPG